MQGRGRRLHTRQAQACACACRGGPPAAGRGLYSCVAVWQRRRPPPARAAELAGGAAFSLPPSPSTTPHPPPTRTAAEVERSILGDGCIVEPDAKIIHSVVGLRSIVREVSNPTHNSSAHRDSWQTV